MIERVVGEEVVEGIAGVVVGGTVESVVVVPMVVFFTTPIVGQRRKVSASFAHPALQFIGEYPDAPVALMLSAENTTNWSEFSVGQLLISRSECVRFFTTRNRTKDDGLTMVI